MQPNNDPTKDPTKDNDARQTEPAGQNDALLAPDARRKVSSESFDEIVRTVREVAAKTADTISTALDRALAMPETVRQSIIIRLNDETLQKIDNLVEAGLYAKRDEAAQFLITEGIKQQAPLFEKVQAKLTQIERLKHELKKLTENE